MAEVALGAITFTGNPVRATINVDPTGLLDFPASSYRVFPLPGNVGDVYGGDSTMNAPLLNGIFWILQPPDPNTSLRPFYQSPNVEERLNSIQMQNVFLDGNVGDTVVVSYMEA